MAQFDYELEQGLAERALKEAQALRGAKAVGVTSGGNVNWLGVADRLAQQTQGNRMEDQATSRLRELGSSQGQEVQRLTKSLMTPGVALRQGEGPLLDPTRPMNAEEENQRQMGIGMEMMQLPKARAMGTQFVNSGVSFPEKMAQQKIQQDLLREQQAVRLQAQKEAAGAREAAIAREKALDRQHQVFLKTLGGVGGANADLQRELLQLKVNEAKGKGGGLPKTTESERVSAGYLGRMEAAEKGLGDAPSLDIVRQKGLEVAPSITNFVMSPSEQSIRQKQEDWVRAKLRKESGATIKDDEMAREIRLYFPQAADSDLVKAQKKQSRAQAVEQLKATAGNAKSTEAAPAVEEWVRDANGKLVRK